jgi:hypothetical protein
MATLDIEGKTVEVDDAFLKLSPEEQQRTVEEIAGQMGLSPAREEAKPEPAPEGDGVALNTTAGLNQALYNTLGGPVDLSRWLINKGIEGANYATGSEMDTIPSDSFGGSESISSMFGAVGVPEPKNVQAASAEERIARGLGEGLGYTMGPAAIVGGASRAGVLSGRTLDAATRALGNGASAGRLAGDSLVGGISGAGATAAMEATPDQYDTLAGLGGGLAAGGVGALLAGIPTLAKAGGRMAMDAASPLYQAGRERLAAGKLADSATDPFALRGLLSEPAEDMVAGSKPTTFQLTGDMGIGGLERGIQTKRPEAFQQRRVDQNSARLSALEGLQADGSPEKVADAARQIVQAVTDRAQAAYDDVVTRSTAAAEAATATGQRGIAQATERMGLLSGGMGEGVGARASGEAMRGSIEEARAAAKATERALWQAVDPDGSLALPAGNTRQEAAKLLSELPKSAKPPSGEEAAIFGAVNEYGETIPFSELTALQSRIKTEMRAEKLANGESPAWRRLSMLSKATDADIESAVAGRLQEDVQAVARGELSFEETIAAKLQQDLAGSFDERQAVTGYSGGPSGSFDATRGGASAVSGSGGAAGKTGRRPGLVESDTGLSQGLVEPNFDPGARDRLTAARTATRERAETFDNKTLGPFRRRPSFTAPYDMAAETVPAKVFFGRPESARAIDQYRRAVGQEAADQQIQQYAVSRLRLAAFNADGSINLNKLEGWRRSHADSLAKLPALRQQVDELAVSARSVADRSDAAARLGKEASKASQAEIAEAARRQRRMTEAAQRSRLGKVMNADSGEEVVRQVGSIFGRPDAGREMLKLNLAARGNPEAREGLRRAVVDHILNKFVGNAEAGASGQNLIKGDQFQTFVKNNVGAIRSAGFNDQEIRAIQAIASDLQRSNRSISAMRIPSGSNTAQDILAAAQSDTATSILSRLVGAYATGGNIVSIVGGKVASALREAGFQTVDDILADALLNPERARLLLQKVLAKNEGGGVLNRLAELYAKSGAATAGVASGERDGGNRTHDWIEGRIKAFGGMSNSEAEQAMDAVRANPSALMSLMKDLVNVERMDLSEADRSAAVRYLLQDIGRSPDTPASRWMGQRKGNAGKTPLEITVPIRVN